MRLLAFAVLRAKAISGNGDGKAGTRVHTSPCESAARCHLTPMCARYTYKLTRTEIINLYRLTFRGTPERLKPANVCRRTSCPIIRPAGNGPRAGDGSWGWCRSG